jgi:hypothetical protein
MSSAPAYFLTFFETLVVVISINHTYNPPLQYNVTYFTVLFDTVQVFKVLALNCLVSAYMMSALYLRGLKQGDMQMTSSGLITAGLFFFLSQVRCDLYCNENIVNWWVFSKEQFQIVSRLCILF